MPSLGETKSVDGEEKMAVDERFGEEMAQPVVEEVEEELDESKMETIREAMRKKIRDDLDAPEDMAVCTPQNDRDGEKVSTSKSGLLSKNHINILADLVSRARYIPMRLSPKERNLLEIAQGALDISEYSDKVDVSSNDYYARTTSDKSEIIQDALTDLTIAIAGLSICGDHRTFGAGVLQDKELKDNEKLFQDCLEIGRRYKIMNPDKMRNTYGKLLYAIMDNMMPRIKESIEFSLKTEIKTVSRVLESADALGMLEDPLLAVAASEIEPGPANEVAQAQAEKREANERLLAKYASESLSRETISLVVASITDNASFLRSNRGPVDKMIHYLKTYFNPNVIPTNKEESLRIRHGVGGSKLNHSHEQQYYFVLQSLTLWREIMGNFFKLWCLAEADLLDERNGYRLCNTGQGLQRCQSAPKVARAMSDILATVKAKVGRWIGLSVVHLGDRDVPNALIFIDKYTQVPRLLAPIARTLDQIDDLATDSSLLGFMDKNFGGKEKLRKLILADYFRHGFDGSGDDGGSCIDGRLTSTWNWCNQLEKKPFHSIFMLTNFQGFDGDFRE